MNRTSTFVIDAIGDPEPVTVQTVCRRVTIQENAQVGTENYLIYSAIDADGVEYPAGKAKVFQPTRECFWPGEVIAYVAAKTTSMTFSQEEE